MRVKKEMDQLHNIFIKEVNPDKIPPSNGVILAENFDDKPVGTNPLPINKIEGQPKTTPQQVLKVPAQTNGVKYVNTFDDNPVGTNPLPVK